MADSSAIAAAQKAATEPSIPLPAAAVAAAAAGDDKLAPNPAAGVVGAAAEGRKDGSAAPAAAAVAAAGQVNGGDASQAQPEELHEVEEGGGEAGRTAPAAASVSAAAAAAGVGGPAGERGGAKAAVPRGGMEDWDPAVLERWGRATLFAVLVLYVFALSFAVVYAIMAVFFVVSDAGSSIFRTMKSSSAYHRPCCSVLDSSSRDPIPPGVVSGGDRSRSVLSAPADRFFVGEELRCCGNSYRSSFLVLWGGCYRCNDGGDDGAGRRFGAGNPTVSTAPPEDDPLDLLFAAIGGGGRDRGGFHQSGSAPRSPSHEPNGDDNFAVRRWGKRGGRGDGAVGVGEGLEATFCDSTEGAHDCDPINGWSAGQAELSSVFGFHAAAAAAEVAAWSKTCVCAFGCVLFRPAWCVLGWTSSVYPIPNEPVVIVPGIVLGTVLACVFVVFVVVRTLPGHLKRVHAMFAAGYRPEGNDNSNDENKDSRCAARAIIGSDRCGHHDVDVGRSGRFNYGGSVEKSGHCRAYSGSVVDRCDDNGSAVDRCGGSSSVVGRCDSHGSGIGRCDVHSSVVGRCEKHRSVVAETALGVNHEGNGPERNGEEGYLADSDFFRHDSEYEKGVAWLVHGGAWVPPDYQRASGAAVGRRFAFSKLFVFCF